MTDLCEHGGEFTTCLLCAADAKATGGGDLHRWRSARAAAGCAQRFPARYSTAVCTDPAARAWVDRFAKTPRDCPSLLLAGPTGVGKTWLAYGTLRAAVVAAGGDRSEAVASADFVAELRPSG